MCFELIEQISYKYHNPSPTRKVYSCKNKKSENLEQYQQITRVQLTSKNKMLKTVYNQENYEIKFVYVDHLRSLFIYFFG